MEILIIISILAAIGFGIYKFNSRNKDKETCYSGENNTVVHYISELKELFPTIEDLETYLSQMVDKDADKGGYFYPPLNEVAGLILNPEYDHGIYTTEYIVEKGNCKDVSALVFVAKEDVKPEPIPEPEKPRTPFELYIFKPFKRLSTHRSVIYEVAIPDDGKDYTNLMQAQMNEFPSGHEDAPIIVRMPLHAVHTEGNQHEFGAKLKNAVTLIENKQFFIIEGGEFYTKAPASPYGGDIGANQFSRRRHFKFLNCSDFEVNKTKVRGSNMIDGRLIGTTPELTPEFWKGGADLGSIGGASAYKAYWEFEHAFDFAHCKRFIVNGVSAIGVWGDGICIGHGNEDYIISYNYLKYCGRQGVAIYDSRRGLIEHNVSEFNRRADIDLEPYHWAGYANEVQIRYNKLHAVQVTVAAIGKGETDNINFHDNEYSGGGLTTLNFATSLKRRRNWAITDNVRTNVYGSPAGAMKIYRVDNFYVANNIDNLSQDQSRAVAQFSECTGVVWENNTTHLTSAKQNPTSPNHAVIYVHDTEIEIKNNEYLEIINY